MLRQAGYIYLLMYEHRLIRQAPHSFFFKLAVTFLLIAQLMLYCIVALAPSIFA